MRLLKGVSLVMVRSLGMGISRMCLGRRNVTLLLLHVYLRGLSSRLYPSCLMEITLEFDLVIVSDGTRRVESSMRGQGQ